MSVGEIASPDTYLCKIGATKHNAFIWIIDNAYKMLKVGRVIKSQIFMVDNQQWQLHLYPKSKCAETEEYFSLYLETFGKQIREATYFFSIVDRDCLVLHSSTLRKEKFIPENPLGCDKFVKPKDLNIDTLRILCQIWVYKDNNPVSPHLVNPRLHKLFDYKHFINDETFSDVKLDVDGTIIHGHKIVLANKCAVLSLMLKSCSVSTAVISVKGATCETIMELMRFIYTGWIDFSSVIVEALLAVGFRLGIPELIAICETVLMKKFKAKNQKMSPDELELTRMAIRNNAKSVAEMIQLTLTN